MTTTEQRVYIPRGARHPVSQAENVLACDEPGEEQATPSVVGRFHPSVTPHRIIGVVLCVVTVQQRYVKMISPPHANQLPPTAHRQHEANILLLISQVSAHKR